MIIYLVSYMIIMMIDTNSLFCELSLYENVGNE